MATMLFNTPSTTNKTSTAQMAGVEEVSTAQRSLYDRIRESSLIKSKPVQFLGRMGQGIARGQAAVAPIVTLGTVKPMVPTTDYEKRVYGDTGGKQITLTSTGAEWFGNQDKPKSQMSLAERIGYPLAGFAAVAADVTPGGKNAKAGVRVAKNIDGTIAKQITKALKMFNNRGLGGDNLVNANILNEFFKASDPSFYKQLVARTKQSGAPLVGTKNPVVAFIGEQLDALMPQNDIVTKASKKLFKSFDDIPGPTFFRGQPKGKGLVARGGGDGSIGSGMMFTDADVTARMWHDNVVQFKFNPDANLKKYAGDLPLMNEVYDWAIKTHGKQYRFNTDTNTIINEWAKANKVDGISTPTGGVVFNPDSVVVK